MSEITLYGAEWCADCRRSKSLLNDRGVEYTYVDLEAQPDAVEVVLELNEGRRVIPTIVFSDGTHLAEPSDRELSERLGF